MSVLAVVSKAVFEKEARVGGKLVGVGDTWPTALYASQNPGLASLASGGALFLVTVRPGDQLWLVGVLEAPKQGGKGWSATPNALPVKDVTGLIPALRFTTGKGVTAEPGKLGMSLQTPRQLTAEDEALLRGGAVAASTAPVPSLAWRLENRRKRAKWAKLTPEEKEQLAQLEGELEEAEEFGGAELMDVIDTASSNVVALYVLWPFGSGVVVDLASREAIADVVQHYFDAHGDEGLRERMRAAHAEAKSRLKTAERVEFAKGGDTPKQAPPPAATPDDPALLAEIRALHAELDRAALDPTARDRQADSEMRIRVYTPRLFGSELRPYPKWRPAELSEAQRAWLRLIVAHYDGRHDLSRQGLPWKLARHEEDAEGSVGSPLSRMMGNKPPLALDTVVVVDGKPHPMWMLLEDVLVGIRPETDFLTALDAQTPQVREGAWHQLASGRDQLEGLYPRDKKEAQRDVPDKKALEGVRGRYLAMLRAAFDRLGEDAGRIAKTVADAPLPTNAELRGPPDRLRLAAIDGLARIAARAGGVLDPKYDEMIGMSVGFAPTYQLIALLALLPIERAGELTGLDYLLLSEFPSESGMRRLVEQIASHVQWQFAKGSWAKLAATLAAKFPEAALPVLKAAKPRLTHYPDGLDKAIEAAEKGVAKAGKKEAKKK